MGYRRIGTIVIGFGVVRRHISTRAYLFGSNMVLATGSFGGSIMLATGLYSQAYWRGACQLAGILARGLINSGSSTVLALGLYSKGQSSPLYTVVTTGRAVEVGYSAAGRTAKVNSGWL